MSRRVLLFDSHNEPAKGNGQNGSHTIPQKCSYSISQKIRKSKEKSTKQVLSKTDTEGNDRDVKVRKI